MSYHPKTLVRILQKAFCAYKCACVFSSCVYIDFHILFFDEDIFTKFAENVNGYENMPVKNWTSFEKEYGQ